MPSDDTDHFDFSRFVHAQSGTYARALSEVRAGRKQTHWMWFIFPQFDGLGFSLTSRTFAIRSLAEAQAYVRHPLLGPRLEACCKAALAVDGRSAREIFGSPDDMKLRSCVTLFAQVSDPESVFEKVLDKYFGGAPDARTLQLVRAASEQA